MALVGDDPGLAVSVFPQVSINNPTDSVTRGLVAPGASFALPAAGLEEIRSDSYLRRTGLHVRSVWSKHLADLSARGVKRIAFTHRTRGGFGKIVVELA